MSNPISRLSSNRLVIAEKGVCYPFIYQGKTFGWRTPEITICIWLNHPTILSFSLFIAEMQTKTKMILAISIEYVLMTRRVRYLSFNVNERKVMLHHTFKMIQYSLWYFHHSSRKCKQIIRIKPFLISLIITLF